MDWFCKVGLDGFEGRIEVLLGFGSIISACYCVELSEPVEGVTRDASSDLSDFLPRVILERRENLLFLTGFK